MSFSFFFLLLDEDYNGSQGQQRAAEQEKEKDEEEEGGMKENKKNKSDRIFFVRLPKDGTGGCYRNVCKFLPHCTMSHPMRRYSSVISATGYSYCDLQAHNYLS